MRTTTDQIRLLIVVILFSGLGVGPAFGAKKGNAAAEHATKAIELVQQKQYDAAIAEFTEAIKADPKNGRLYANRGAALLAAGMATAATDQGNSQRKIQDALADCSKAVELAPTDHFGYMERAQVQLSLFQYDAAMVDAQKTIELKPDEANGYKFRGFAYIGLTQWDKAAADFTSAIEKKPEDMQNYDKRAQCYRELKQYDQAVADYNTLLAKNPGNADTLVKRGYTLALKEDYEKAIPDYEAALKLNPADEQTVSRLQYARTMLAAKNAPPPTPTPAPTPEPRGVITPLNIGIVLAVILIAAIIIKVVRTRGKPEASTSTRIR